ncbi:MAG: SusC/RagA family TonB-linked outer membrane protein [Bacteroidales bacterium]|nr:SusC/RagA family TonB-linked outer membrane protein [Bacteroidales bacterium]
MSSKKFFSAFLGLVLAIGMNAQNITVKGTVTDETGEVIVGAGVVIKGTLKGANTDLDGNYLLSAGSNDILVFTFLGMKDVEVAVNGRTVINVTMTTDSEALSESVVTALGMKRETKALGYAVTAVSADEVLSANTVSPVAALQGKVAGVEINQGDGGMFGSTKIQIRGASTLGKNNQPIYVIDGVILDNGINTSDADWDQNSNDYGNQLKNLNPDDFASISVLKGAAATALYGSRGLNGAVVITTKSGKANTGIGVNFSQTLGIDYVYDTPGLQSDYLIGDFPALVYYGADYEATQNPWSDPYGYAKNEAGVYSLIAQSDNSYGWGWGAPISMYEGQPLELFDGTIGTFKTYPNRYKDAFRTGYNTNTHISINGGNDRTSFYASASYKYNQGTTENNTFNRLSFLVKASHKITDKLQVEASFNFANSNPRNAMLNIGDYFGGGSYPAEYNTKYYKDKYKGAHGGLASGTYGDTYRNVPGKGLWWAIYENNYEQKETSIRPTLDLKYDILPWLTLNAGGNYNYYVVRGEGKYPGSGYANEGGDYTLSNDFTEQVNAYYGVNANKQINEDWEVHGFLRGEYFDQNAQYSYAKTEGGLIVPNQYFIANSKKTPNLKSYKYNTKRITSAVFAVGASWKNQAFLDITGRNDWSSALVYTSGRGNFSYFYPSVSGSWIANETFRESLPKWISFAKFRASWAQVGNDTTPYYINSGYNLKHSIYDGDNDIYSLELPSEIKSTDLKPEKKTSYEFGIDWRFFENRIGLDFTYYKENTRNQIMSISVPDVSGIRSELVNAGDIQNSGIEVALNTTPVKTKDWQWDVDFTYTRNRNKIVSLHEDVADYIVLDGYTDYGNFRIGSVAKVGGEYGMLMTDSKIKLDEETGLPLLMYPESYRTAIYMREGTVSELGSMLPKFLGSISTTLRYKTLALRVSLDARFGGLVASYNSRYALSYGFSETSLKYREGIEWTSNYPERVGITYHDGYIPEGIFRPNTVVNGNDVSGMTYQAAYEQGLVEPAHMTTSSYFNNSWGNGVVNDDWVKELNYISLREVTLSYTLPMKWANAVKARSLSVSATGRNLGYLLNTAPNHENPEGIRGTGASNFRMRSFAPYTASYMFTINASF